MNNVNLVGRIGKDPTVFTFDSGDKKTNFSLAVDDGYWSKEKGEWIERTQWLGIVMNKETKFKKGDLISVSGKITNRSYKNKDDETVYITEIIAYQTKLLNRKNTGITNESNEEGIPPHEKPKADKKGEPEDDLPF